MWIYRTLNRFNILFGLAVAALPSGGCQYLGKSRTPGSMD